MATDACVLQALIDANDQAVFALDRDLRYLAFNGAHADGMRALYDAQIEIGGRLTDYQTVAADQEGAESNLRRALAGERVVVSAFSGEEGRQRYYELVHVPLTRGDEVEGVIVFTSDETERHAAETEQRESEARYRGYFEQPLVGAAVTSPDMGWIDVNQAACDLLGYTHEELARLTWAELTHPDDLAADVAHFDRVIAGEIDAYRLEKRFIRKDGGVIDVDLSVQCRRAPDGAVDYFLALLLDITERKRAEAVRAFLARTGSGPQEEPFFQALARYLAESLDMFYVCIDRLEGDGLAARTVAVWCDDHFEDNVTYALADTPCGQVASEGVCCFPASVCQFFPRDQVLQDLRAESYIGATLYGHTGLPIGLIAVIGHDPIKDRELAEETLELVAARAADELERLDAEDQLRETRDYLENLFGYANAPVIVWDPELRVTRFNRAFEELTQRAADEVVGRQPGAPLPRGRATRCGARARHQRHGRRALAGRRDPHPARRRRGAHRALELRHGLCRRRRDPGRHHRPGAGHHRAQGGRGRDQTAQHLPRAERRREDARPRPRRTRSSRSSSTRSPTTCARRCAPSAASVS